MNDFTTGQIALDFTTKVTIDTLAAPLAQADEAPDRQSREDRLATAHAVLASGLSDVRDDRDAMARFLAFRSRFHEYSLNNTVLIWTQNPAARFVKGYRAWQAVGRQVRKGEHGITILAPIVCRATKAEIAAGADPNEKSVVGFRTATVFDYAQSDAITDGALIYVPPAPRLDADDPEGLVARLEHVALFSLGYRVSYADTGYADGMCQTVLKWITVQQRLSPADRASVLCHELCHAVAHAGDTTTSRAQKELQAEGAAFVVLAALGLDTSRASLPYLKSWAAGEDAALLAELAAIDRIAADLLALVEAAA
jgi:antirestriction protein ArdC